MLREACNTNRAKPVSGDAAHANAEDDASVCDEKFREQYGNDIWRVPPLLREEITSHLPLFPREPPVVRGALPSEHDGSHWSSFCTTCGAAQTADVIRNHVRAALPTDVLHYEFNNTITVGAPPNR